MKYLKRFEAEIWNGARHHYNGLKPVNQEIFTPQKLNSFYCNNCKFKFATYDPDQKCCSICDSEDITVIR